MFLQPTLDPKPETPVQVIVVLEAVKEKATEKREDVRVLLNGELYLPKGIPDGVWGLKGLGS